MFLGKVQATLPRNHIKYVGLQYIVKGTEENKLFDEAVELFKELWRNYAAERKGLYIAGKTY